MISNLVERAVDLFKHTVPATKAITMACEDLSESSSFLRLLVDADCAHHGPYSHCVVLEGNPVQGVDDRSDSRIDVDQGSEASTVIAMGIDTEGGCPAGSGSDANSDCDEEDGQHLLSEFAIRVVDRLRELAAGHAKHMVLHKFDYEENSNTTIADMGNKLLLQKQSRSLVIPG